VLSQDSEEMNSDISAPNLLFAWNNATRVASVSTYVPKIGTDTTWWVSLGRQAPKADAVQNCHSARKQGRSGRWGGTAMSRRRGVLGRSGLVRLHCVWHGKELRSRLSAMPCCDGMAWNTNECDSVSRITWKIEAGAPIDVHAPVWGNGHGAFGCAHTI